MTTQRTSQSDISYNQRLRQSYDREAAQYDALRYESAEGRFFSRLEVTILKSWLPLRHGGKVLDMPAGTGRLSIQLSDAGVCVVGTDISHNMLAQAEVKARKRKHQPHFVQGSGLELPFQDNTFDAVVSFKFFHLVPNDSKPQFIRELARVLKPGCPLIVEFNSPFYGVFLAAFRYYFRKKYPGRMRTKCLFPDQVPELFSGLEVKRRCGVKLPAAGAVAAVLGTRLTEALNLWFGRLPGLRYLAYAIVIEARKPIQSALSSVT
jgi:ubiquinone/menaquinone biosynthesis C-methylase UbiE